ncbi:type II CAAX prenyl endopeptidase Rce1 family protein [Candidatus Omnitrophota bacterium]
MGSTSHMGFLSWIDLIFVFVVAMFFAWVVKKTGSLFGVILAHGATNIMLYLIAPFFFF